MNAIHSTGAVTNETLGTVDRLGHNTSNHLWDNLAALLVGGLLLFEIVVPFPIQIGLLPGAVQNLDNLILVAIVALVLARMFIWNRFPQAGLLILALAAIGIVVATFEGQGPGATAWGLWEFVKYPLVGLVIYLQPYWPAKTFLRLRQALYLLLVIVVVVQQMQWVAGEPPGDNLAGIFGLFGTSKLVVFLGFVLCFALAQWIVDGTSRGIATLGAVIVVCSLSSALSETKLFVPIAAVLAGVGLLFFFAHGGKLLAMLPTLALIGFLLVSAIAVYNITVADTQDTRRFEEYFNRSTTEEYLIGIDYDPNTRTYYMRRGTATAYAWALLQRDVTTMLFGYGIGARTESRTLGIVGRGLEQGYYGLLTGTSLLVLSQELGLVGLGLFGGFAIWLSVRLIQAARRIQERDFQISAYALTMYTIMWPVWLWYSTVWTFGLTMVLYWGAIGLLMHRLADHQTSVVVTAPESPAGPSTFLESAQLVRS